MMQHRKLDNYIHYYLEHWDSVKDGAGFLDQFDEDIHTVSCEIISTYKMAENPG